MTTLIETCIIKKITIPQISRLKSLRTSKVDLYEIPWCVEIFKKESSIWVRLICKHEDDSSDWSVSGGVSCKLLPFSDDLAAIKGFQSNVFYRTRFLGVCLHLTEWDELFNEGKKYVKDDTIKLELKIEAENPNDPKKCCVTTWRNCENNTKFQMILKNVPNLMAVQAHPFKLNGLTWHITVGKDSSANSLFAYLQFGESKTKSSCDVTWSMKLLSLKEEINPIEKTEIDSLPSSDYYSVMENIVSWDELFKAENGYVHNDSMTLEFELKSNKQRQSNANGTPATKRAKTDPSPTAPPPPSLSSSSSD